MPHYFKWVLSVTGVAIILLAFSSFNLHNNKYEPVLMTRDQMEAAVRWQAPRDIKSPGKIWVFNEYIFVIELYRGIHILDNADSANPENVAFIQVDGCTDVAVKDGIIYANNAVDLIGIKPDLQNNSLKIMSRNRDVIPELLSPDGQFPHDFMRYRPKNTIIVRYDTYKD